MRNRRTYTFPVIKICCSRAVSVPVRVTCWEPEPPGASAKQVGRRKKNLKMLMLMISDFFTIIIN